MPSLFCFTTVSLRAEHLARSRLRSLDAACRGRRSDGPACSKFSLDCSSALLTGCSRRWCRCRRAPGRLVVLPLVDAGGVEAQLRGADRRDVAAGAAADDDDVECLCSCCASTQMSNSRRAGSSSASFIATRPSTGLAAVDDAVVVAHRQVVHRPHHDLAVLDHRAVLGRMHAEDGRLRRVDDRRGQHRAEHAAVADRERAAGQLLDAELAVAAPCLPNSAIFFSMSAKLIWSALRRIGTTRPRGEPTAMPMSK